MNITIEEVKIKVIIALLVISSIGISGCMNYGSVPVIKANITYVDNQSSGIVDAVHYTFTEENVSYIDRPKKTQADRFPAIAARVMTVGGNSSAIGPWEMVSYNGSGDYSFNIGYPENYRPVSGDLLHITVMVVDKTGQKIGYIIDNIKK
jgi:hypothetical protein